MIKRIGLAALLIAAALPLRADFRDVEHQLRAQLGSPTYIPMLGLVRFATWIVHPKGVHDFQLAVWEDNRSALSMDGSEFEERLRRGLSPDFQPVVRVRSRNEWTFIYARPAGERFEMILLNHDHSDTVLVRADVDGEQLSQAIRDHELNMNMSDRHYGHRSRR